MDNTNSCHFLKRHKNGQNTAPYKVRKLPLWLPTLDGSRRQQSYVHEETDKN